MRCSKQCYQNNMPQSNAILKHTYWQMAPPKTQQQHELTSVITRTR